MAEIQFPRDWVQGEWTLFSDRDGVLNYLITGDYIKSWEEFHFLPGAKEALAKINPLFKRIIIATNQRGIKRGVMTAEDLEDIHQKMLEEIEEEGGRIDGIYYCANHPENDLENCRKPAIGMALQAQRDFPEIDFSKSIMLGDNISDMEFGRNAGMYTVFICQDGPPAAHAHLVDDHCQGFVAFAESFGSF
ncbi:MAG: HAD family hydrolase [Bacteroidia bacterium]|nr:HAD family hydrolase [Bacteroidia bacterium]